MWPNKHVPRIMVPQSTMKQRLINVYHQKKTQESLSKNILGGDLLLQVLNYQLEELKQIT